MFGMKTLAPLAGPVSGRSVVRGYIRRRDPDLFAELLQHVGLPT